MAETACAWVNSRKAPCRANPRYLLSNGDRSCRVHLGYVVERAVSIHERVEVTRT